LSKIEQRVTNALTAVGLDYDNFARRMWDELSGGEAQRVALAARLILKPEILLMDEPVASVDTESARLIRDASLKARQDWGTTLVIASHDLEWLFSVSDRQVSILEGKVFYSGRENIIPGPYEPFKEDMVIRHLGNDQKFILKQPAGNAKMAVIQKKKTALDLEKHSETDGLNQVKGQIMSMSFEKKRNRILIKIAIEDLEFELRLLQERVDMLRLYPGKTVFISFHPQDVDWI
jgi:tungstate transport system ATP-binding protein